MSSTDPREEYDDLHVTTDHQVVPDDEFVATADSEAATAGWCAFALTVDPDGRVLLIRQGWADGWLVPGGARKPGETLRETAVREVREETGVDVTPVRPHAVHDYTVEHAETGETTGWTGVFFEARAEVPALDQDPGVDDEPIEAVEWFHALHGDLFTPDHTRRLYERARGGTDGEGRSGT